MLFLANDLINPPAAAVMPHERRFQVIKNEFTFITSLGELCECSSFCVNRRIDEVVASVFRVCSIIDTFLG